MNSSMYLCELTYTNGRSTLYLNISENLKTHYLSFNGSIGHLIKIIKIIESVILSRW